MMAAELNVSTETSRSPNSDRQNPEKGRLATMFMLRKIVSEISMAGEEFQVFEIK